jgi:hypothetical protein
MPEYTPAIDALTREIPKLYLDRADDAYYIAEAVVGSEWLAAHDAAVRADQAEKDASIAECFPGPLHSQQDIFVAEDIAATIRAVVLTPTTKETEQ